MKLEINLYDLAEFLVRAKISTYANKDAVKLRYPERLNHQEFEFTENGLCYRDSYVGHYQFSGMEEVRLENKDGPTIWTMAYFGGLTRNLIKQDRDDVFNHLKESLALVSEYMPFRGPNQNTGGKYHRLVYASNIDGDIERFKGDEQIKISERDGDIEVYALDFIGGLVK